MKTNMKWVMALWLASLGAWSTIPGCKREDAKPTISAADQAASEKAAVDKALAEKSAADRFVAEKAAAEKMAAEKIAADKSAAVDQALANKAAADKVAAEMAAKKDAADKLAAQEKLESTSLPTELVMMKSEMGQTLAQIDLTLAKIDVLSASTKDFKQPSKDAIASIDALDAATQGLKKRANDMRERGASYFEAWDKQLAAISTPEVAAMASKRKGELSAKYAEVLTSMQETRAAFDPFWADMTALRSAVDDGLKADTAKNLAPMIQSAKQRATTLRSRVETTSSKLSDVAVLYKRP